jgi:xanthine/uracil/vitamin C permease (AzgA family)
MKINWISCGALFLATSLVSMAAMLYDVPQMLTIGICAVIGFFWEKLTDWPLIERDE